MNMYVFVCERVYSNGTFFRVPIAYVNVSRILVCGKRTQPIHPYANTHEAIEMLVQCERWRANAEHIHLHVGRHTHTHIHSLTYKRKEEKRDTPNEMRRGTHGIIYTLVYSCMSEWASKRLTLSVWVCMSVQNENVMNKSPQHTPYIVRACRVCIPSIATCVCICVLYSVNVLCMWDFLSAASNCICVCIFNCTTAVCICTCTTLSLSVALSLFSARSLVVSQSFVSVFCSIYDGISFLSNFFSLLLLLLRSNFIISSHRIILFFLSRPFARSPLLRPSLSFVLPLALFCTYAPVAYLCQSTNEEKMFFCWVEQIFN